MRGPRLGEIEVKSRRAFTIVELMVAVSILAILVTLAVVGFRSINRAGKNRDTATRLQAAKTMLDEFIRVNRGRVTIPTGTLDAPGNVEKGSADRTGKQYSLTRAMMGQIMRIPENKAAVSGRCAGDVGAEQ
jgi:prepilin-type N-terminal cleavage/methylation domain-containing protein